MLEPREHLVPDPAFDGHFNLLRAYVAPLDVGGGEGRRDYVGNWELGLPSELALLTLYDPRTGVPRAIIDATSITEWRTGAVTAIGARHLARKEPGCSVTWARAAPRSQRLPARPGARPRPISVTSARAESRAAFGERLEQALGKPVRVMDDVEATVRGADVVVEATRLSAPEPILRTEWIAPAALVIPYGTMSAVELSLTSIMDKVFVDDWGQCRRGRFGALRAHVEQGLVTGDTIAGELADVVVGTRPGREHDDERILFWHRGLATTDIALGQAILDRAVEQEIGTLLPYR